MNQRLALPLLLLAALIAPFCLPAQSFLTNGLVAYYPFNGNANDESGNRRTGTVVNAVLQADRFGRAGQSYQFNGTSSYVTVANSTELAPVGDFTLSLWMNQKSTNAPQVLVAKALAGDNTSGWHMTTQDTPSKMLSFQAAPDFSPTAPNILPPPISNWGHVTFTYVRSSGGWKMYLDGVLKGSGTKVFSLNNAARPLVIGAMEYPGPPFRYFFNGALDDIRIYNRTLDDSEVQALHVAESIPPDQSFLTTGLVAYYPFNGNAGDASGNGNTATNLGTFAYTGTGKQGGAVQLIGDNSPTYAGGGYVALPSFAGKYDKSMTLSLWVKTAATPNQYVAAFGQDDFGQRVTVIPYGAFWMNDSLGVKQISSSLYNAPDFSAYSNVWKHMVLTYEAGRMAGYIDGILVGQSNVTFTSISTGPGYLGHHYWALGSSSRSSMDLDNVRIYNRALPDAEVQALFAIRIASPPFLPKLAIEVSRVNVKLNVVLGRRYQLQSSDDLLQWANVGATFVAQDENLVSEFVVGQTGRFFRVQEVP